MFEREHVCFQGNLENGETLFSSGRKNPRRCFSSDLCDEHLPTCRSSAPPVQAIKHIYSYIFQKISAVKVKTSHCYTTSLAIVISFYNACPDCADLVLGRRKSDAQRDPTESGSGSGAGTPVEMNPDPWGSLKKTLHL